jgi:NAD(P)-dependent dehydrogenase (short-subunit alcohol dehydrogenase family)
MATILITGANRGIGLEFCKQYLSQNNKIFACCRDLSHAEQLQQLQLDFPRSLAIIALDITSETSIQQLKTVLTKEPIDIVINNAGIFNFADEEQPLNSRRWQTFFQINTVGPYLISQLLMENIELGTQKKIINISSDMGSIGLNKTGGYTPYRASKAALNAITKNLAIEIKDKGITVVAVHPGWVQTDMGGPNGLLSPQASVSAMTTLIAKLTILSSGKFYDYAGKELAW